MKQLSDATQTRDYFISLGDRLTRRMALTSLGEGAFTTVDGSVIVQKDDKVLLVDVNGLPTRFGVPSEPAPTLRSASPRRSWAGFATTSSSPTTSSISMATTTTTTTTTTAASIAGDSTITIPRLRVRCLDHRDCRHDRDREELRHDDPHARGR